MIHPVLIQWSLHLWRSRRELSVSHSKTEAEEESITDFTQEVSQRYHVRADIT
ncbi:hypothetical protein ZOSMA_377G00050 [Zostera marina]|uniref:Uncharacterized protein n=1 Tax=Zostera marina TaxID=29655 RepID=A0A0K9P5K8_ZOSMR|nr:hypothetical protein ZOSMA_377G00050 [Zostera marina]